LKNTVKVVVSTNVIINSAALTLTIAFFTSFPLGIREEVTTGPHPPPPVASKIPPIKPRMQIPRIFLSSFFNR